MKPDTITSKVLEFVATKDEVTAPEIAAFLLDLVRKDLDVDEETYAQATFAKPVIWRGASSYAKDIIKRPRVVEAILEAEDEEEDEDQPALFEGLSAFVRVDRRDGEWRFKRRHSLTQEEYRAAMVLLREKHTELAVKIGRYQSEYDRALPYWAPGMTFGDAVAAVSA